MTKKRKIGYNVKMMSTLNLTLLITNLMKRIVSIAPRKLKDTLNEEKQMICQIRQSRDVKPKTNKRKKIRVEILGDSMLHGIQEKG